MAQQVNTVILSLEACGVPDTIIFDGTTWHEHLANDIFDNDFTSCIDKSVKDLIEEFKDYSILNVNEG